MEVEKGVINSIRRKERKAMDPPYATEKKKKKKKKTSLLHLELNETYFDRLEL